MAVRIGRRRGSVDEGLRRRRRRPLLVGRRGVRVMRRVVRRVVAEAACTTQQKAAVTRRRCHIVVVVLVHGSGKRNGARGKFTTREHCELTRGVSKEKTFTSYETRYVHRIECN